MKLLGRANWWLPGWLDRLLPAVDIERGAVTADGATEPVGVGPEEDLVTSSTTNPSPGPAACAPTPRAPPEPAVARAVGRATWDDDGLRLD